MAKTQNPAPMKGYQILKSPQSPSLAIFAVQTDEADHLFLVTREILEELAAAFERQASNMPRRSDLT